MKINSIENQFVDYTLAKQITELGFKEECIEEFSTRSNKFKVDTTFICGALLYQQVFDWFEEEFGIYCSIDNILLDYSVSELTKEGDIKILKPMHSGVTHKNKTEVKESCIKYIIKRIKQNETNITTRI